MFKINLKFLFIFIFFFISKFVYAEIQKKISIIGNENIDDEIIFSIIDKEITDYSKDNINEIIKILYQTGNFKSIEIEGDDKNIILKIKENPTIDKIEFFGNKRFKDEEIYEIFDKEKYFNTFNEFSINNFISDLKSLYASFGYNITTIDYKIFDNDETDQLINLRFDINEGNISKVNKIYFIGNKYFSDFKLKSLLETKERNYLKLTRASNYKSFKIQDDKRNLLNFYKNSGFKNVQIEIKEEFVKKNNRLNLYIYIDEGERFQFRKIDFNFNKLNLDSEITEVIISNELKSLSKIIKKKKFYNPSVYNESIERLTKAIYQYGKYFFKIDVSERTDENYIDILFDAYSIEPKYVNSINIYGNTRTKEHVIRREITFVEGDPYNEGELSLSKRNIQKLNFFKSIEIKDKEFDNQVDLDIKVEEKSTGEFQIGVGIDSYDGATFITGLKEKNIFGDGREVNLNIDTSSHNTIYSIGVIEPYIFNKDMDLIYDISYAFKDRTESKSYDLTEFNTDIGLRYDLTNKISHSFIIEYVLKDYDITGTSVSDSINKLAGNNADILIDNKINYFDLDSYIRPSRGTNLQYLNILSPATNDDNGYIKNIITFSKYYPIKEKNIFSFKTKIGNIFSLQNKELPIEDKFSLGGNWLRGFDRFGVGPRDSRTSYVGGRNLIATKFDFNRPIAGSSDNPIDFNIFTDIGTVFDNKIDPTHSDESIRASYGFGFQFYSPIGPIGFLWGFPIIKEDHDIEKMFTFSLGLTN